MSFSERRCRASRLVPFAAAIGLLMGGAGGATAVAAPGSPGSTGQGGSGAGASSQGSSSFGSKPGNPAGSEVGSTAGNPAGSVAGTLRRTVQQVTSAFGSGQKPGPQAPSGATTQIGLSGMNNTQGKHNAGLVAAVPNVVASVPNADPPIPNLLSPVTNVVPLVPSPLTPVTNAIASVPSLLTPVTNAVAAFVPSAGASGPNAIAAVQNTLTSTDPDFISHTTNFGLFTNTAAADPDDHEFVATVFSSSLFTDILTSGADPSGSLGFGQTGVGVPGQTVNTLVSPVFPFLDSTIAIPITDPFAALFTALIPFGA
jgi:hypothetical protein